MRRPLTRLGLLLACATCAAAQVAAVHPDSAAGLDPLRVRDMLLGRITTWPDGTAVVVVLVDDPAADAALEHLIGRGHERLLRGWKRLVFSGAGVMPMVVVGRREACELIARRAGAIGVLDEVASGTGATSVPLQGR